MAFTYTFGGAQYRFSYDRQCLVRADIFAAELLAKAANDAEMEFLAAQAKRLRLDQDKPLDIVASWTPQDKPEAKPAAPPEPKPEPGAALEQLMWDLEHLEPDTTDNRVRLEILRYTLSMVRSGDLGSHFMNHVARPGAIA